MISSFPQIIQIWQCCQQGLTPGRTKQIQSKNCLQYGLNPRPLVHSTTKQSPKCKVVYESPFRNLLPTTLMVLGSVSTGEHFWLNIFFSSPKLRKHDLTHLKYGQLKCIMTVNRPMVMHSEFWEAETL